MSSVCQSCGDLFTAGTLGPLKAPGAGSNAETEGEKVDDGDNHGEEGSRVNQGREEAEGEAVKSERLATEGNGSGPGGERVAVELGEEVEGDSLSTGAGIGDVTGKGDTGVNEGSGDVEMGDQAGHISATVEGATVDEEGQGDKEPYGEAQTM